MRAVRLVFDMTMMIHVSCIPPLCMSMGEVSAPEVTAQ